MRPRIPCRACRGGGFSTCRSACPAAAACRFGDVERLDFHLLVVVGRIERDQIVGLLLVQRRLGVQQAPRTAARGRRRLGMRICSWLPYFVECSVVTADQQLLPAEHRSRGQWIARHRLLPTPCRWRRPRARRRRFARPGGVASRRATGRRPTGRIRAGCATGGFPSSRSRATGRRRSIPGRCRRRERAPRRIARRGPLRCRGPAPAGRTRRARPRHRP